MIDKIINTFKSQNKYFWFIAVRMFSFLIIGFETFFGPKIIGLENFAVVEYEKQLINLSAILLFGLHTGYGISYFKSNKKNKSTSFLLSGLFYILILFGIYSVISQTFSFGIIVFLLSIMMEQLLKIKNKFNLAILFKPLFSILLVTYYSYYYFFSENLMGFAFDVNLIYLMAFILFVVFTYKYLNLDYKEIHLNLKEFKEYLKNGFQPNLSTSLIITIFFLDRFLIEKYYESSLGVYSIAYNFSLISFLIASSLAYITSIKIGEKLKEPEQLKKMINRLMKVSYVYILVVLVCFIPIIIIINKNWFKIEDFEKISFINLIGKTFLGATSFYTSIVYYKNKEYYSWILLSILLFLIIITDFYFIINNTGNFMLLQYISNFSLVTYCVCMNYVVRKKII